MTAGPPAKVSFVDPEDLELTERLQAAAALPGKRTAEQQLKLERRRDAVEQERRKAAAAAALAKQKKEVTHPSSQMVLQVL